MDITQAGYYLFVGISLLAYWLMPKRGRWMVLLLDSVIFCAINTAPGTFIYMALGVLSVYGATRLFEIYPETDRKRKLILVPTILLNVGFLVALKYTNLFINTINFFGGNIKLVSLKAPLALSFYTLTLLSYLLDCYWGITKAEKNPLKVILYIFFFPLMVSGPILRAGQSMSELFSEKTFDYERTVKGMRRAGWGLLKKVVLADRIGIIVAYMFDNPELFKGLWVFVSAMAFVIELYLDFSGCMDIVIGISSCFGIEIPENFKAPFLSKDIQEFWQRWHITLGTWLRDYIMVPMLRTKWLMKMTKTCKAKWGKQGRKIPTYIAMWFVWTAMGIWHGNSWKYVIGEGWWFWLLIVLGQVFEPFFKKLRAKCKISDNSKLLNAFRICRTFLLYSFGMIFFRAKDLPAAIHMIAGIFSKTYLHDPLAGLYDNLWNALGGMTAVIVLVTCMIIQVMCDFKTAGNESMQTKVAALKTPIRWILYFLLILVIIEFGEFGKSAFIYFGF